MVIKTTWYWYKNRHIDEHNRIETPEINPHLYSQLIFCRGSKHMQWAEDSLFNKWCWENWTHTWRKMKLGTFLHCTHRQIFKMDQRLNVIPETIKILEENIGSKSLDIFHRNFYWIYLPRQWKQKEKRNKLNYIKLKSFFHSKGNHQQDN